MAGALGTSIVAQVRDTIFGCFEVGDSRDEPIQNKAGDSVHGEVEVLGFGKRDKPVNKKGQKPEQAGGKDDKSAGGRRPKKNDTKRTGKEPATEEVETLVKADHGLDSRDDVQGSDAAEGPDGAPASKVDDDGVDALVLRQETL